MRPPDQREVRWPKSQGFRGPTVDTTHAPRNNIEVGELRLAPRTHGYSMAPHNVEIKIFKPKVNDLACHIILMKRWL